MSPCIDHQWRGVLGTFVVSDPGVEGVIGAHGALEGPASSAKRTFDGVACFIWDSISLSDGDIFSTNWKD